MFSVASTWLGNLQGKEVYLAQGSEDWMSAFFEVFLNMRPLQSSEIVQSIVWQEGPSALTQLSPLFEKPQAAD